MKYTPFEERVFAAAVGGMMVRDDQRESGWQENITWAANSLIQNMRREGYGTDECPKCEGGKVVTMGHRNMTCPDCSGTGQV